jgi:hypothetical protein
VKIHFAGDLAPDNRSLWATMVAAYRGTDPLAWSKGRADNLRAQGLLGWRGDDPIAGIQASQFFGHVGALDVLAIGLVGFAIRGRPREPELTLATLVGCAAAAWLLWMAVMFRGGSAVVHHGSYTTTLLFLIGGAVGLASWGRIGSALLTLHVVGFAVVWLLPRAGIPVFAWKPVAGVLFIAATLGAAAVGRTWLDDGHSLRKRAVRTNSA